MGVAIIILAAAFIASGIRGTYKQLGAAIVKDFTGENNFTTWLLAIGCVGIIGYVPALQKWSRVFLALILCAIFLRQGTGVFAQFVQAVENIKATPTETAPGATIADTSGGQPGNGPDMSSNANPAATTGAGLGLNTGGSGTSVGSAAGSAAPGPQTTIFNPTGTTQAPVAGGGFSPGAASGNDAPMALPQAQPTAAPSFGWGGFAKIFGW